MSDCNNAQCSTIPVKSTQGSIASCINKIPASEFALLGALLGVLISGKLNPDEQNSIGNFIVSVGQSVLTIAAQAENQKSQQSAQIQRQYIANQIDQLSMQLDLLKKQLKD